MSEQSDWVTVPQDTLGNWLDAQRPHLDRNILHEGNCNIVYATHTMAPGELTMSPLQ